MAAAVSDLLAATGWIGEHPSTGEDVAHLLLHPATDLDPGSPAKIAALAAMVGAMDAHSLGFPPAMDAEVDTRGVLRFGGQIVPLPADLDGGWTAAASAQGFVVVSITSQPLAAPGLVEVDHLIESGAPMWLGRAVVHR